MSDAEENQLVGWLVEAIRLANREVDKSSETKKYWLGYLDACVGLQRYLRLPTE